MVDGGVTYHIMIIIVQFGTILFMVRLLVHQTVVQSGYWILVIAMELDNL